MNKIEFAEAIGRGIAAGLLGADAVREATAAPPNPPAAQTSRSTSSRPRRPKRRAQPPVDPTNRQRQIETPDDDDLEGAEGAYSLDALQEMFEGATQTGAAEVRDAVRSLDPRAEEALRKRLGIADKKVNDYDPDHSEALAADILGD